MATKNLARTVLEGGRYGSYKSECDRIEAKLRTESRRYEQMVRNDVEDYDDCSEPSRIPFPKRGNQTDKLGPVYRFLKSKVGQPWDQVRSEICEKFDGRTLAGRHILHDHILKDVCENPEDRMAKYRDFKVDEKGLLQVNRPRREHYHRQEEFRVSWEGHLDFTSWANGRALIARGEKFYWAIPSREIKYEYWYGSSVHIAPRETGWTTPTWRQGAELSKKDYSFFCTYPVRYRNGLFVAVYP